MALYRAIVQGNTEPLHEVQIRAHSQWDAIDSLEAKGYEVIDVYSAPIMAIVADEVLRSA